jgi:hypothetical protein
LKEEGPKAFFKGFSAHALYATTQSAISMAFTENFKQAIMLYLKKSVN